MQNGVNLTNPELCLILGFPLNALLIYLIKSRTAKQMKVYSRILLQTCYIDLYMLFASALIQPVYTIVEGDSIVYFTGLARHVKPPNNILFFWLWLMGLYFIISSMSVQFVYRYLVLCKGQTVSLGKYIFMLLMALLYAIVVSVFFCVPPYLRTKPCTLPANSTLFEVFPELYSDHFYLAYQQKFISFEWLGYAVLVVLGSGGIYSIIAFCSVQLIIQFTQKSSLLRKHLNLEKIDTQINLTLFGQAMLPLFYTIVLFFAAIYPILSSNYRMKILLVSYVNDMINWIPVIDPLVTLVMVKNYRKFIFGGRGVAPLSTLESSSGVVRTQNKDQQ